MKFIRWLGSFSLFRSKRVLKEVDINSDNAKAILNTLNEYPELSNLYTKQLTKGNTEARETFLNKYDELFSVLDLKKANTLLDHIESLHRPKTVEMREITPHPLDPFPAAKREYDLIEKLENTPVKGENKSSTMALEGLKKADITERKEKLLEKVNNLKDSPKKKEALAYFLAEAIHKTHNKGNTLTQQLEKLKTLTNPTEIETMKSAIKRVMNNATKLTESEKALIRSHVDSIIAQKDSSEPS